MKYAYLALLIIFGVTACVDAQAFTCRKAAIKKAFDISQGYPKGRPGYIVDHICALAQGGIDSITNMQYQTLIESDIKDRIENTPKGKALWCNPSNSTPTRQVFNCK